MHHTQRNLKGLKSNVQLYFVLPIIITNTISKSNTPVSLQFYAVYWLVN